MRASATNCDKVMFFTNILRTKLTSTVNSQLNLLSVLLIQYKIPGSFTETLIVTKTNDILCKKIHKYTRYLCKLEVLYIVVSKNIALNFQAFTSLKAFLC